MNTLTISLVTIMIPGVILALIYDTYTQHKAWDSFRYVLMSIVFGILTYLVMQIFISSYQFVNGIKDTDSIKWYLLSVWSIANGQDKIKVNPAEILAGGLVSIPLGLLFVYLSTKRIAHEYLLKKGISNKYGDDNVFIRSIEVMCNPASGYTDTQCWILLKDDDQLIHGHIALYNENDKTQEVSLCNATVYESSTGNIIIKTSFLYVSKEYGKIIIFKDNIEDVQ